jgi:ferredoxin/flavodoxin---NADP+ reductase
MALEWREGRITDRIVWADGLFTLKVEADGVEPFAPGQFLHVGVPLDSGAQSAGAENDVQSGNDPKILHRPYSVASPWGKSVEFFIVLVPEGELTPKLWDCRPGNLIYISKRASGRFTLDHTPRAENLWLMATGTGLAPYIAMLRDPEVWNRYNRVIVVHGVRMAADLAYCGEMNEWAGKYPGRFHAISALTREHNGESLHGRLPGLLADGQLEKAAGCSLLAGNSAIMLCGNPAMLDDMEQELGRRGIQRHRSRAPGQLVVERYW